MIILIDSEIIFLICGFLSNLGAKKYFVHNDIGHGRRSDCKRVGLTGLYPNQIGGKDRLGLKARLSERFGVAR